MKKAICWKKVANDERKLADSIMKRKTTEMGSDDDKKNWLRSVTEVISQEMLQIEELLRRLRKEK